MNWHTLVCFTLERNICFHSQIKPWENRIKKFRDLEAGLRMDVQEFRKSWVKTNGVVKSDRIIALCMFLCWICDLAITVTTQFCATPRQIVVSLAAGSSKLLEWFNVSFIIYICSSLAKYHINCCSYSTT